jgi:hypothetical protein
MLAPRTLAPTSVGAPISETTLAAAAVMLDLARKMTVAKPATVRRARAA